MLQWRGEGLPAGIIRLDRFKAGLEDAAAPDMFAAASLISFEPNAEIFAEGEPTEHLYQVVSGAVRSCRLTSDGRRHIGAFYLPGDVFGLEADGFHRSSAESVRHCRLRVVRRSSVLAKAARDTELMTQVWEHTARHLERAQEHLFLLGRKSAQERIAAFLLEMAERLGGERELDLPMSRQDIADYLGLTIETVSRTLTQMERDGVIGIPTSRRIVLRSRGALDHMNDLLAA